MFRDRAVQYRGSICSHCLLMRLQQVLKFLQLFPFDHTIQIHLFQDHVTGQLLTAFVFVQSGQHSTALLTGGGQQGADQGALKCLQSLSFFHCCSEAQLVISPSSFYELSPIVLNMKLIMKQVITRK